MSFNPQGGVSVPLSVFSSLVTEMSPSDLPEGASPDNQEVVFAPGNVATRSGLSRVFAAPFPGATALHYAKSYVDNKGVTRNLYLDNNGVFWVENVSTSPGTYAQLFQTAAGNYAKSVTTDGREYIAISDGLAGRDIPIQYDGQFVDRVTQEGPAAPPVVVSLGLPSVDMAIISSGPVSLDLSQIFFSDPVTYGQPPYQNTIYTTISIIFNSAQALSVGQQLTVAGTTNGAFNGQTYTISQVVSSQSVKTSAWSNIFQSGFGGTATPTGSSSNLNIARSNNLVTAVSASPHQLQPGFQVTIANIPTLAIGGGVASIVIENEALPGLAVVTTNTPHGLVPGAYVNLNGITGTTVGGTITAIKRTGQVVTVTTSAAHGLSPGSIVTLSGVSDSSFDTTFNVFQATGPNTFTTIQVAADATSSGGTIALNWPVPNTSTPNFYQVQAVPSATSFQVAINYSDGVWTSGTVAFAWDGTYFVSNVLSPTVFQYRQYGPDAAAPVPGSLTATVTPYGQATPGKHQCRVAFLTRQGYITRPSPPIPFIANGGQYLSITDIPIGPNNIVGRILEFTGSNGSLFYYIPTPAEENGLFVSTSTQINDNSTTSVLLDFGDNTLYAATATSIPGNNLAAQIVLDSALGFGSYGSRLIAYGQRNTVQNLLNMSFDGGYSANAPTLPLGWVPPADDTGQLAAGHVQTAWQISVSPGANRGQLAQHCFLDAYGAPIIQPNTRYKIRVWLELPVPAPDVVFAVDMSAVSNGFRMRATISGVNISTSGTWLEADFDLPSPNPIPQDLVLYLFATSVTSTCNLLVDDLSIIYSDNPFVNNALFGSYVNNPEAFDGLTGKFGPADDTHKVMDLATIRETLYLFTQDPGGRIHQTSNNTFTEPAGWVVNALGANCGVLSAFCLTKSQADDTTASGGEEWLAWASESGARIFGGDQPWKISQEIQPDWDAINPVGRLNIWALNDPVARVVYFGLPLGGTNLTPNLIYPMNYRGIDTAYEIAMGPPVHTAISGRLVCTEKARKWTRWNIPTNGAARMYRADGSLQPVFLGQGFANAYTLLASNHHDDDYGRIAAYYVTYFFVSHDTEMALQLGAFRKIVTYLTGVITGIGQLKISFLCNTLTNVWPYTCLRDLSLTQNFDFEYSGGNAKGQRFALRIEALPESGIDNYFALSQLNLTLKPDAKLPVRGTVT